MSLLRMSLLSALAQVSGGGSTNHDELIAIRHPDEAESVFSDDESEAYWALWRWADDADIRAKEPDGAYEELQRINLTALHQRLAKIWETESDV